MRLDADSLVPCQSYDGHNCRYKWHESTNIVEIPPLVQGICNSSIILRSDFFMVIKSCLSLVKKHVGGVNEQPSIRYDECWHDCSNDIEPPRGWTGSKI